MAKSTENKPKATKAKGKKRQRQPSAQPPPEEKATTTKAKATNGHAEEHDDDDDDNGDDNDNDNDNSSSNAGGSGTVDGSKSPGQSSALPQYVPAKNMDASGFAEAFWRHQFDVAETVHEDFKTPELPLARVKRVMKTDPEVAMIASEVPVILEKACQIFIADLTARAYIDSPKRRTLTKLDVARAARQTDMFDFLIDVLPRETGPPPTTDRSRRGSLNSQQ